MLSFISLSIKPVAPLARQSHFFSRRNLGFNTSYATGFDIPGALFIIGIVLAEIAIPPLHLHLYLFPLLIINPIFSLVVFFLCFCLFFLNSGFESLNSLIAIISLSTPLICAFAVKTHINVPRLLFYYLSLCFIVALFQAFLPVQSDFLSHFLYAKSVSSSSLLQRITLFSSEPSFAAESYFPFVLLFFNYSNRFSAHSVKGISCMILFTLWLIRARTSLQQFALFALVYIVFFFLKRVLRLKYPSAIMLFMLLLFISCVIFAPLLFFGYIQLYASSSLDLAGSWRLVSTLSSVFGVDLVSFNLLDTSSWATLIQRGMDLVYIGTSPTNWIVQPFSLIGVAALSFGILGMLFYVFLIFYLFLIFKRSSMGSVVNSVLSLSCIVTLLLNGLLLSPKWSALQFLVIPFIAHSRFSFSKPAFSSEPFRVSSC